MEKDTPKTNPYMEDWKKTIQEKTKDELVSIMQHKTEYDSEYIEMVEQKLENDYGTKIVIEESPHKAFKEELSENQMIRKIGGKLSIGILIIICSILGILVLFCVGRVRENYSYGAYWNVMWWSIMTLCISSILIQLIIGKVNGTRNNNN